MFWNTCPPQLLLTPCFVSPALQRALAQLRAQEWAWTQHMQQQLALAWEHLAINTAEQSSAPTTASTPTHTPTYMATSMATNTAQAHTAEPVDQQLWTLTVHLAQWRLEQASAQCRAHADSLAQHPTLQAAAQALQLPQSLPVQAATLALGPSCPDAAQTLVPAAMANQGDALGALHARWLQLWCQAQQGLAYVEALHTACTTGLQKTAANHPSFRWCSAG